jgi:hypothetical protein
MNPMKLFKFLRWFLLDQYIFHMAEGDPPPPEPPEPPPEFEWPEGWRAQIAGEDEKDLGQLERYKTPADIWTKARSLEQKMSSGEWKQDLPFPADGTDEDKASWREARGLPAEPGKYELSREVDESEKENIDGFLNYAFEHNLSPVDVNAMVDYFYDVAEKQGELVETGDREQQELADDALRSEWGGDYRGNINRIDNLIATAPAEVSEILLDARLSDGTKLRSSPEAMKFLLDMAVNADPITTVVGKGGDKLTAVEDELDEIKTMMREDRAKYNNSPKVQARYRELLEAQSKLAPKS